MKRLLAVVVGCSVGAVPCLATNGDITAVPSPATAATVDKPAAPPARPTAADGTPFPPAGPRGLSANLPVVRHMLGAVPEATGLRKVWPILSRDPVVVRWRQRLAAHNVAVAEDDYIGPGVDFGAEAVVLGLDNGRVYRVTFFMPTLTPTKLAAFTAPLAAAGLVRSSTCDTFDLATGSVHLTGRLDGSHVNTVKETTPYGPALTINRPLLLPTAGATYSTSRFPSAVEVSVAAADWYAAVHDDVDPAAVGRMRPPKLVQGMTIEQAIFALGPPDTRDTDGGDLVTLTWTGKPDRPGPGLVIATFDRGRLIAFAYHD